MARHPANKAKAPFVKPSIRTGGTLAKLLAVVQLERVLLRGGDASPPDFQSFERKYGGQTMDKLVSLVALATSAVERSSQASTHHTISRTANRRRNRRASTMP